MTFGYQFGPGTVHQLRWDWKGLFLVRDSTVSETHSHTVVAGLDMQEAIQEGFPNNINISNGGSYISISLPVHPISR